MNHIANMGLHNPPLTKPAVCETHGDYESRCYLGRIWTACPACADDQAAKERTEAEAKEQAARVEAWQRKIGESGIHERFRDRRLTTYRTKTDAQRRALAFAQTYAANFFDDARKTGRSALFIGLPGTGKTHLAVGIGMEVMDRGGAVLFTTVMRAMLRVKDTWRRNSSESESDATAALVFPDLLILDEVGVQFGSDTEKLILFNILNERYEKRRPTILMSNLPIDEVAAYLGARVFDRLREDGGEFISFTWESYRKTSTHGTEGLDG